MGGRMKIGPSENGQDKIKKEKIKWQANIFIQTNEIVYFEWRIMKIQIYALGEHKTFRIKVK